MELLWKVGTPKRLAILRAMAGGETISVREAARRGGRDVKAARGDVRAAVDAGVLDDTGHGVRFGCDAMQTEFNPEVA